MGRIWSDENKYACWLEVEVAASEALAGLGEVPLEAAQALRAHAAVDVERLFTIEREVKHDVIAFTTAVAEKMAAAGVGEASRWFHYGMTSNDVVDTAQALQVKQSAELLLAGVEKLLAALKTRAYEFQNTVQMGRTHGIHAEPYTFGLKLALWYDELRRNRKRLAEAAEDMRCGKISGAVGTFGHIGPEAEEAICERLGLRPAAIASQVISRDSHAAFINALALIAALCEKIAIEVRHLQRTEVREAEEPFAPGQKGSSAMPHKRNPISAETITGLSRVLRANAQVGLQDVPLWHERDISHSSAERIVLPDSASLALYMVKRMSRLLGNLEVDTDQMVKNLNSLQGVVFSQSILLALVESGLTRDDAYRIVQTAARTAIETTTPLRDVLVADTGVTLDASLIDAVFDLDRVLQHAGRAVDALIAAQ
jgi:adenylosuccinate lyase